MLLALLSLALVALLLTAPLVVRTSRGAWRSLARRRKAARSPGPFPYDPGRERRAEQRARELLRSCVNDEEWAMYRDLGFIRVHGALAQAEESAYGYLIYPHKPIVAYVPAQRPPAQRVLRRVPRPLGRGRALTAARLG